MNKPANYNDLTGQKFGKLAVLYREGTAKNRTPLWCCRCDCGNYRTVRANHLMHSHTTSCGCYQKRRASETTAFDLVGQKFNRLTVIKESNRKIQRAKVWLCECDCGNFTEVRSSDLISNHTQSCGCYHFDRIWKGGISCEPYCISWTEDLKEYIKYRDNNICLNPDCWKRTNRLAVHHIDYNKKNCNHTNLITICTSCNTRANTDRKWHKAWYQAILNKRYGYVY